MAKSVGKNFGYNLVLTFCKYLFPLITYPYVSRVLGVNNIGICNFVDSLVNYFILFSTLGIGSYGVREIAKCRGDLERRNLVFSSLLGINFFGTILAVATLVLCTLYVPNLQAYREFLWIGLVKLVFNMFLIEWFFQGLQEFKYITVRSVAIRFLYVIGVFVFVRSSNDANYYYALTVGTTVLNALCNWTYSTKYRSFSFKNIHIKMFLAPVLIFGYYRLLTYMYSTFNVTFLGFCSGDREVGYFATATKLYTIIMGVFTAFTTVMVPRVSELLSEGDTPKLQKIANDTFQVLTVVSIPIILFCVCCSSEVITLIAGPGYEGAYLPFKIVIVLLLIIGMEQIVIQQFLMAAQSSKPIFIVSSVGAVVGISMNAMLTPRFGAVGSSISWGVSELAVLCFGLVLAKKHVGVSFNLKFFLKNLGWSLVYLPLPLALFFLVKLPFGVNLVVNGLVFFVLFLLINLKLNKNQLLGEGIVKIMGKMRNLISKG